MVGIKTLNRRSLVTLVSVAALTIAAVTAIPATLSADDSPGLQAAPVNPAFQEYRQNQARTAGGDLANTPAVSYGYMPPTVDLGHIETLRNLHNPDAQAAKAGAPTRPAAFNWTAPTNRVTSIKNQNPCGTCWTFNNASVMESRVWISGGPANQDYSEQALNCCMDPCWIELAADRCNTGGNDFKAQDTLIKKGASLETCQPYNTGTINTQACLSCAPVYMTTNFVWVAWYDTTVGAREAIKDAIQTYGPVTVAYYHNGYSLYGTKYYYTGSASPNHAVSIVGWDDSITHPAGGGSGAWLAKNSWGPSFGDGGYYWLCYGKSSATSFGSLQGVKAYDSAEKLYYLDEAGYVVDVGWTDYTAWAANTFTASVAGSLTHVDFYTGGVSTQYDIMVYRSGNINSPGTPAAIQAGTCGDAPGYYSIALATPVALTTGEAFTVAVKMTTPEYGWPIAVEYAIYGICDPTIQAGRSYIKHFDYSAWEDLADYGWNACLRARVQAPPAVNPPADQQEQRMIVSGSHSSTMTAPSSPAPPVINPVIQAQNARLSATTVAPGTPVIVTAGMANSSTVNGSKRVTLYVNGQVESVQGVTVSSGGTSELTFSISRNEPGDYMVYVDSVPAGSFKVEVAAGPDLILMFSAALVALAFLLGLIMLWRRHRPG